MKELSSDFLLYFTSLFTVVNPIGTLAIFSNFTEHLNNKEVKALAKRTSFVAGILMIFLAISGQVVFSFFSISLDALRVVGGILLGVMGYDMLQAKTARTKKLSTDEKEELKDLAITPLAIPLVCGPGAITVSILLFQHSEGIVGQSLVLGAICMVALVNFLILSASRKINHFLGSSGRKVLTRLMGLIIMMIAVEFFFTGIKNYLNL